MFAWNAFRLARLRSAVRAYNRAITMREAELAAEGLSELSSLLPERVTVEGVMSRINTANDFRRIVGYRGDLARGRSSELTRVLKSYDPHALDITTGRRGAPTTKYAVKEERINRSALTRMRNAARRNMSRDLVPGDPLTKRLDDMDFAEYANAMDNTDMYLPGEGVPDDSVEDLDAETYQRWEQEDARKHRDSIQIHARYDSYMGAWKDPLNHHEEMGGFDVFIDAMEWMRDNRPDMLSKMFDSGADEVQVAYLIDSGGKGNPYHQIPVETRHARALDFVTSYAARAGWSG